MSWDTGTGRQHCNRCRQDIPMGASVWVGPVTKQSWCELCAHDVIGAPPKGSLAAFDDGKFREAHPEFTAAMQALKARAALKLQRSERSFTGERE